MPQVDLENLVSACAGGASSDNKIACETLADNEADNHHPNPIQQSDQPDVPPDFPPESFWLSKDAEFDWFDQHAFYERKDSQKGNSNPTHLNPNPSSTSQRFSTTLKSKASIIGLPKPQKTIVGTTKTKRHCKPENTRLFPKRIGSSGKSLTEPSSPKVSCMGRVRSKRDRRRLKKRQQSVSEPETRNCKPERTAKPGLISVFRGMFRARTKKEKTSKPHATVGESPETVRTHEFKDRLPRGESATPRANFPQRKSVTKEARESANGKAATEPVGLGGMNRFSSGRRSDSWAADVA